MRLTVIPLPPLETQHEIVARIETKRAIVHGNRELIRIISHRKSAYKFA